MPRSFSTRMEISLFNSAYPVRSGMRPIRVTSTLLNGGWLLVKQGSVLPSAEQKGTNMKNGSVEQGATKNTVGWRTKPFMKRLKAKAERRRVRQDVECFPGYGKYAGWVD